MTAPERRRPLPALAFIGALCLLTAIVWFRVIHRSGSAATPKPTCTSSSAPPTKTVTVVPHERKVTVLMLNSTNRKGIAGDTKKALIKRGFKITEPPANDGTTYGGHGLIRGVAEIRYGPSSLAAATLLRLYLPHAVLKATDASSHTVIISLGAKFKQVASPKAVRRAFRADHLKYGKVTAHPPSSSGC
jgi:hypothetical protein